MAYAEGRNRNSNKRKGGLVYCDMTVMEGEFKEGDHITVKHLCYKPHPPKYLCEAKIVHVEQGSIGGSSSCSMDYSKLKTIVIADSTVDRAMYELCFEKED